MIMYSKEYFFNREVKNKLPRNPPNPGMLKLTIFSLSTRHYIELFILSEN